MTRTPARPARSVQVGKRADHVLARRIDISVPGAFFGADKTDIPGLEVGEFHRAVQACIGRGDIEEFFPDQANDAFHLDRTVGRFAQQLPVGRVTVVVDIAVSLAAPE